jgi:hypothetical protein
MRTGLLTVHDSVTMQIVSSSTLHYLRIAVSSLISSFATCVQEVIRPVVHWIEILLERN